MPDPRSDPNLYARMMKILTNIGEFIVLETKKTPKCLKEHSIEFIWFKHYTPSGLQKEHTRLSPLKRCSFENLSSFDRELNA